MTVQDAPRWLCLFFVHIVRHDLWLFWLLRLLWFLWCLVAGIGHDVFLPGFALRWRMFAGRAASGALPTGWRLGQMQPFFGSLVYPLDPHEAWPPHQIGCSSSPSCATTSGDSASSGALSSGSGMNLSSSSWLER